MSIEAIVRDVGFAVFKPFDFALCEVAIAGLSEFFEPEKVAGDFGPEFLRIGD